MTPAALLLALAASLCPQPAHVVRVVDGDTYVLRVELGYDVQTTVHVRLAGLDTPERGTAEGRRAAADAEGLLRAGAITVQPTGARTLGRHVASVYIDGVSLAAWLRSAGHETRRD